MKRDLEFAITYPQDIVLVWHVITDPEAIAQWLTVQSCHLKKREMNEPLN